MQQTAPTLSSNAAATRSPGLLNGNDDHDGPGQPPGLSRIAVDHRPRDTRFVVREHRIVYVVRPPPRESRNRGGLDDVEDGRGNRRGAVSRVAGLVAETGVALLYGRLVTRGERRDSGAGPLAFATKRGVAMRDAAIG